MNGDLVGQSKAEPVPLMVSFSAETQDLHENVDKRITEYGVPYLNPKGPSVQVDLFNSKGMETWQLAKGTRSMLHEESWSELPQVYARYGTESGRKLLARLKLREDAKAVVLADCGMQATALLFDSLILPGSHILLSRQIYNKTKGYAEWLRGRFDFDLEILEEINPGVLKEKINPKTTMVFVETYSNPLMRALNPLEVGASVEALRAGGCPRLKLVVDHTIATTWGTKQRLLNYPGIDFLVAAGTKAMGGEDRDLWGYIASNDIETMNGVMDFQGMRGGGMSWQVAESILEAFPLAERRFRKRCDNAIRLAKALEAHPRVERVFHPSLESHCDRATIREHYALPGSIVSFRLTDVEDEERVAHFCDVLAMPKLVRYALSFDGLVTKVNHHKTVSEYYSPDAVLKRQGIDRLVRMGVGTESGEDIERVVLWALDNYDKIQASAVVSWEKLRRQELGLESEMMI
ncbi:MAG: PLP-dependent transferase [Myxococcota bacterium]|nr:PLP-dependent transferase [Myxococcota bacterium]